MEASEVSSYLRKLGFGLSSPPKGNKAPRESSARKNDSHFPVIKRKKKPEWTITARIHRRSSQKASSFDASILYNSTQDSRPRVDSENSQQSRQFEDDRRLQGFIRASPSSSPPPNKSSVSTKSNLSTSSDNASIELYPRIPKTRGSLDYSKGERIFMPSVPSIPNNQTSKGTFVKSTIKFPVKNGTPRQILFDLPVLNTNVNDEKKMSTPSSNLKSKPKPNQSSSIENPVQEMPWRWYVTNYSVVASNKWHRKRLENKLLYRPPPDNLRGKLWMQMLGSTKLMEDSKGYFEYMLKKPPNQKTRDLILKDLDRTRVEEFSGKNTEGTHKFTIEKLKSVLCAYAIHDPEVGYCQGLNYICGILLLWMTKEEAFYTIVTLLQDGGKFSLRHLYLKSLPLLKERYFQFEQLLSQFCPQVFGRFKRMEIHPAVYSSRWFLTLFSYDLPVRTISRIWDLLFFVGPRFIFQIGIGLIQGHRRVLLELKFEKLIPFLQDFHKQVETFGLLKQALETSIKSRHMDLLSLSYESKSMLGLSMITDKKKRKRKPENIFLEADEFW